MKRFIPLLLYGAGLVTGYLSYAGVAYAMTFLAMLSIQATGSGFDVEARWPKLSDRYWTILGGSLMAIGMLRASPISRSAFATFMATAGGAALAMTIIWLKPDILRREEKPQ